MKESNLSTVKHLMGTRLTNIGNTIFPMKLIMEYSPSADTTRFVVASCRFFIFYLFFASRIRLEVLIISRITRKGWAFDRDPFDRPLFTYSMDIIHINVATRAAIN
jgi:hypothetical protein